MSIPVLATRQKPVCVCVCKSEMLIAVKTTQGELALKVTV